MNTDDQRRICFDAASGLGYFLFNVAFLSFHGAASGTIQKEERDKGKSYFSFCLLNEI